MLAKGENRVNAGLARRRHDAVTESLQSDIMSGVLSAGTTLPSERALSERFSVGRTTIREALLTLKRRGLIEIRNGAPARVTEPSTKSLVSDVNMFVRRFGETPEGVRYMQHARALLEVGLAREAALFASEKDRDAIKAAFDANVDCADDLAKFAETDIGFHFAIAQASHNPIFIAMHDAVRHWLTNQRLLSRSAARTPETVVAEHAPILAAILDRDGAGAAAAMEAHLAQVVRNYWLAMTPAFARVAMPEGGVS
jgi:GntR family transcriptional regulator, sialic acid-inducible nan operon repressor